MAEFLVESYVARTDARGVDSRVRCARRAAAGGTAVRYLRSFFVPEDEICFLLFEAASADDVRDAARRADLHFERISEAVPGGKP